MLDTPLNVFSMTRPIPLTFLSGSGWMNSIISCSLEEFNGCVYHQKEICSQLRADPKQKGSQGRHQEV